MVGRDPTEVMYQALACQQEGRLGAAEILYREALQIIPESFDALHMLGVVRLQLGDPEEGARLILEAIRVVQVEYPPAYGNLGLCLVAIARKRGIFRQLIDPEVPESDRPQVHFERDLPTMAGEPPLVSVVMPCFNHERFVAEALRSVFVQTYRNLELIVIDDGSRDASVQVITEILKECPFSVYFNARENQGAHHTINECIHMAHGHYVAILNADDRYAPGRIETLVRVLTQTGMQWGFTGVRFMNDDGDPVEYGDNELVDAYIRHTDEVYGLRTSTASSFLGFNCAISAGNLFFEKNIWEHMGGFREYQKVFGWDFCLRALLIGAPSLLYEPFYHSRVHAAETIPEPGAAVTEEADRLISDWIAEVARQPGLNPKIGGSIFAEQSAREWRLLMDGRGHLVRPRRLIELAQSVLAGG